MLARELHPHPPPDLVEVAALHVRVGPGEVDELEDAQRGARRARSGSDARLAPRLEDDDLAGLDVADVLGADDVEARGLRREDPAAPCRRRRPTGRRRDVRRRRRRPRQPPEDERPEPERVADADHPALVEDDEAVRARARRAGRGRSASTVSAAGSSARSAVSSSVSVDGRKAGAAAAQLRQQLAGVDEVAVVADRERPARPEPERRLGVLPDRRAGRRVAAVGDREVARGGSGSRRSSRTWLIIPRSL